MILENHLSAAPGSDLTLGPCSSLTLRSNSTTFGPSVSSFRFKERRPCFLLLAGTDFPWAAESSTPGWAHHKTDNVQQFLKDRLEYVLTANWLNKLESIHIFDSHFYMTCVKMILIIIIKLSVTRCLIGTKFQHATTNVQYRASSSPTITV